MKNKTEERNIELLKQTLNEKTDNGEFTKPFSWKLTPENADLLGGGMKPGDHLMWNPKTRELKRWVGDSDNVRVAGPDPKNYFFVEEHLEGNKYTGYDGAKIEKAGIPFRFTTEQIKGYLETMAEFHRCRFAIMVINENNLKVLPEEMASQVSIGDEITWDHEKQHLDMRLILKRSGKAVAQAKGGG